jgi:hypothetical protein
MYLTASTKIDHNICQILSCVISDRPDRIECDHHRFTINKIQKVWPCLKSAHKCFWLPLSLVFAYLWLEFRDVLTLFGTF